jgi:predicted nucleic acid-binding protein
MAQPSLVNAIYRLRQPYRVTLNSKRDNALVALMIQHQVPKILTFNDADFRRFAEIQADNPFDVLSLPRV